MAKKSIGKKRRRISPPPELPFEIDWTSLNVIDPRKLSPGELLRLVNSTPLGAVLSETALRRHRNRAGYRIGTARQLDLVRYAAWLFNERHPATPPSAAGRSDYAAHRDAMADASRRRSASGRDIGEPPEVKDPARRDASERNFRSFCETYFPETFNLAWSPDQLKVLAKIEKAVLDGGLFAMAMPRGSGKTSLCETACLWAILFGHRRFVALIGSDEGSAIEMMDSLKMELETNELLLADFPRAVFPIEQLDGIAQRANGQSCMGARTHMEWKEKVVVMPTVAESRASGAIIRVAGITGRIRGMKHKRRDGEPARPDLVILDDPQTDESARSDSQNTYRLGVVSGAVLGLAGPGKKIAGFMPCTVIARHDMADRVLNREDHPEWQGERMKMMYSFPKNTRLWTEYEKIRAEDLKAEKGLKRATAFYRKNRKAMDAGAAAAWEARRNPDELSAVQHAMNLRYRDEAAFFAEYQNEPLDVVQDEEMLTADQIAAKINRIAQGAVPIGCDHVTAFIDIQQKLLYWMVCAWGEDFTGAIVDYGAFPDQGRRYFTLLDARRTLAHVTPRAGIEGRIFGGLEQLTGQLLGREWKRDDGAMMRAERCLIDANWGISTDTVYQFCRQSEHAAILMPGHGRFVGASSKPFSEYKRVRGERLGHNWRIPSIKGRRAVRHVLYDANYWKSFVHARLAVPMGDKGSLSIFGTKPAHHRLLADHLTAEYKVRTEGRGRTVDEWKLKPNKPDNHWLDCLAGAAVAASMQGVTLATHRPARVVKRKTVSFAELQRQARGGR